MEGQHGDSHATETHKAAATIYGEEMTAEGRRFDAELATVTETHAANVRAISDRYTTALVDAGGDSTA